MKIRTIFLAMVPVALLAIAGCSDDTKGGSGGGGSGPPRMPTLGKQIDRMGRPAINTAANKTFEPDPEKADIGKNDWNINSNPTTWKETFVPEVEKNIAILDSLDTVCGNQLLADMTKSDATRYAGLAGVLADDRLYVNATGAMCTTYLAVEANSLGMTNNDCGGRTLAYDVIDASYTLLATGKLDGSVGDKIAITDAAKGTAFPYLAAPY